MFTQAGVYIMTLFDWYSGGLNLMIIALCEVGGIAWIYGTDSRIYAIRPKLHCTDTSYEHQQRTSSQQFNTTNGQKFATSQHLDMSRCWALALRCGKFVVELF